MTDQEIIEQLATEFMGWQFTDDVLVIGEHVLEGVTSTVWVRRPDGSIGVVGAVNCRNFAPLHDPAACALVKAELRRRRWWYQLTCADPADRIECRVSTLNWTGYIFAGTEERAVCLAVLKVLEQTD